VSAFHPLRTFSRASPGFNLVEKNASAVHASRKILAVYGYCGGGRSAGAGV
jgi:hypothetical protein